MKSAILSPEREMYVSPYAIFATVVVVVMLVYIALRRRVGAITKPAGKSGPKVANPAVIESLRQNLRLKTGYNEPLIDRLIQFERERLPNAPLQSLMESAIERWERDNR